MAKGADQSVIEEPAPEKPVIKGRYVVWYTKADDAIDYAKFYSRSHDTLIRVYDAAGNVIETHEHAATSRSCERE